MQRLAEIPNFPQYDWTKSIPKNCFVDRDKLVVEQCRGMTVLHVGAADAPFEVDKGRAGELLHQKIQQVAQQLIGVDVDDEAIRALTGLGIDNIICADICSDDVLVGQTFDVVLCCDVIEHVTAPGALLAACRRFMRADSKLIVTTINATAMKPALRALMGKESVHNDHVGYYSFATLGKLLTTSQLRPVEFAAFAYPTVNSFIGWLSRSIMSLAPGTADGIVINARRV